MYVIGKTGHRQDHAVAQYDDLRYFRGKWRGGGGSARRIRGIYLGLCSGKIRINDVVYFNPDDLDYPIAFNAVEKVDIKERHLVSSGPYLHF